MAADANWYVRRGSEPVNGATELSSRNDTAISTSRKWERNRPIVNVNLSIAEQELPGRPDDFVAIAAEAAMRLVCPDLMEYRRERVCVCLSCVRPTLPDEKVYVSETRITSGRVR